jgi:hypothetical protein
MRSLQSTRRSFADVFTKGRSVHVTNSRKREGKGEGGRL